MSSRTRAPRRRWKIKPWPWPGDTAEDKAKRIALSYRQLVFTITQGRCADPAGELHRLDQHWAEHGHYWPRPQPQPVDDDDWLYAADLAHLIHKAPTDIYRWARRGHIDQRVSADGCSEYSLASARRYLDEQRNRHRKTDLHTSGKDT
ncbi:hypothetical protein [Mycobacterium sp. TY813]|uniref:hypothetical protein n=1 Tax=Mycobacterium TaxID=1763 RepID=UPI0027407B33|nr:hypothetical protein [Mycobacterium sp. TY813]MDP7729513.1 hypothetical protein [Mycobacterium sp. TY813]